MPKIAPTTVPRHIAGSDSRKSCRVGHSPLTGLADIVLRFPLSRLTMISASPNNPMESGTKPMPSYRMSSPIVSRNSPVDMSVPTTPNITPSTIMPTAFSTEPWARTTADTSPRIITDT